MTKCIFNCRWPQITEAAKLTLASSVDTLIQNMALLVLEELGRALAAALEARTLELSALKEHWINILSNALVPILQNEHSPIMPGACDILSTIGSPIFLCIQLLSIKPFCSPDVSSVVKGSYVTAFKYSTIVEEELESR